MFSLQRLLNFIPAEQKIRVYSKYNNLKYEGLAGEVDSAKDSMDYYLLCGISMFYINHNHIEIKLAQ